MEEPLLADPHRTNAIERMSSCSETTDEGGDPNVRFEKGKETGNTPLRGKAAGRLAADANAPRPRA